MSLLVEELFDYTAQTVNGLSGGTGWSANWVGDTYNTESPAVVAGDLSYAGVSNGSTTNKSKFKTWIEGDDNHNHSWSRNWTGINNTSGVTIYMSWVMASYEAKGTATLTCPGLTTDSGGATPIRLGYWTAGLADYTVKVQGGGATLYTGSSSYVPHLITVKVDMSGAAATPVTTTWYVDQDPLAPPSTWTAKYTNATYYVKTAITGWSWISNTTASSGSDDLIYIDNFRIATTSYESFGNGNPGNFFNLFLN